MDFGYRANPSTLIKCGMANGNELYFDEQFYLHKMKMEDMDLTMRASGQSRHFPIFGDPASGRVIDDLQDRGWPVIGAEKGPNSVQYGLALLNQYKLFVTQRSVNMINEQKKYRYKIEKDTGNVTNDPIKKFDHTWDAARYWAMMSIKPLRKLPYEYKGMAA